MPSPVPNGTGPADTVAASPRAPTSRPAFVIFSGLFIFGCVLGLVDLLSASEKISTGTGVAVANTVHVVIAAVLVGGLVVAWRRDRNAVIAFARTPFTVAGWRRLMRATIAVPCALAEIALLTIGRKERSPVSSDGAPISQLHQQTHCDSLAGARHSPMSPSARSPVPS